MPTPARLARVPTFWIADATPVEALRTEFIAVDSVPRLPAKALTAGQVYKDYDIKLFRGEKLRATASVSNSVDVTGLYVDISRGSAA